MSDTENTLIDSLFEQYYELFPNIQNIEIIQQSKCEHLNKTITVDQIYHVCQDCGSCLDYTNIQYIDYELIKSGCIRRYYKKTNYLKLKINKIIKNMNLTASDISTILKEFIRYNNIYTTHKKKIKYDFILYIILKSMGKDVSKVKKFKAKLEKKRLKEYNELMNIGV